MLKYIRLFALIASNETLVMNTLEIKSLPNFAVNHHPCHYASY